jgi:hypothetical protein
MVASGVKTVQTRETQRVPALDPRWLPDEVRRYVQRALPGEASTGSFVRLTQEGEMTLKPGARPRPFTATEELEIRTVEFCWEARFRLLGPISMYVTDGYREGLGQLSVRLSSLKPRVRQGPELAEGEALRYLAELPWVPHAIPANPQLEWRALDKATVEVATRLGGRRVAVRHVFDESGEIVKTIANRPRAEAHHEPTPWVGSYRDYRDFGGVRAPAYGEVAWELPDGPFTYWRGTITSLELKR